MNAFNGADHRLTSSVMEQQISWNPNCLIDACTALSFSRRPLPLSSSGIKFGDPSGRFSRAFSDRYDAVHGQN